jgi:hypothetical protein
MRLKLAACSALEIAAGDGVRSMLRLDEAHRNLAREQPSSGETRYSNGHQERQGQRHEDGIQVLDDLAVRDDHKRLSAGQDLPERPCLAQCAVSIAKRDVGKALRWQRHDDAPEQLVATTSGQAWRPRGGCRADEKAVTIAQQRLVDACDQALLGDHEHEYAGEGHGEREGGSELDREPTYFRTLRSEESP